MTALIGFIMIILLIVLLVKYKALPISVFATLPLIAAFVLGFGVTEVFTMAASGIINVLPTAALFVGSITYFGIMSDAGLFDRPVNWLVKKIKPNTFGVLVMTVCIAMISHLDGSGATTMMITVPVIWPILKKVKMRILPAAFMVILTMSIMNFLPWGGPLGRAATVVGTDTVTLWKIILPVQIFGVILLFGVAWLLANQEEKKGFGAQTVTDKELVAGVDEKQESLRRPQLFWANLILTIVVIALLFLGCPAFLPFLIGIGIALPLNYGKGGERAQTARIKAHAGNVVPMIITIIGAGIFLGVLQDGGIAEAMAEVIVSVIPASLGKYLHIVMAVLAVPMSMVFEADTMNYGILPVVAEIGASYGISQTTSALAIAIGHNMGVTMCMTSATVYFGLGLFELEYGEMVKYNFLKVLAIDVLLVIFAVIVGVL